MSSRAIGLSPELYDYVRACMPPEHPVLAWLREETAKLGGISRMQIGSDQGQLMQIFVRMLGARKVLEIGCFTGYSSTAMALAMAPGGLLITCDVSEQHTKLAREAWARAGVADRVSLRLAPALETCDALIAAGESGTLDLAFIDADKRNYEAYWERCMTLLRPGGVVLVDNVLWGGSVIDPSIDDEDTRAIRRLNGKVGRDPRVASAMIGIGDGLTIAVRS
ncbi:O-methyltransferase [Sandaracinus amylolyticus]|uniref:O-methyltransferase n=1 Tax=Sandaracinus amylolyticus TaxID=927083 RepID=A0A0F6W3U8_9BACT|nr:class I SAM-dependent methyltransferase [Sandaracinus amylolyticus]AKF06698.1 O-methyltransferase [Sandaracinus amylolyticus]